MTSSWERSASWFPQVTYLVKGAATAGQQKTDICGQCGAEFSHKVGWGGGALDRSFIQHADHPRAAVNARQQVRGQKVLSSELI